MASHLVRIHYNRPHDGESWKPTEPILDLPIAGGRGWQCNGGPGRKHPARGLPFSLEFNLPPLAGKLLQLHFVGIFALFADPEHEPVGSIGANILLFQRENVVSRINLLAGTHYGDPSAAVTVERANGDGTSLRTVAKTTYAGEPVRIDILTMDVPDDVSIQRVIFRDMGTAASFVLFDIIAETEVVKACPFRGQGEAVALSEIGTLLRLRDRSRFQIALQQVRDSLTSSTDIEEARGIALTFIAVVHASLLELGAGRRLHRFLLDAARQLDELDDRTILGQVTDQLVQELILPIMPEVEVVGDGTMDRAMEYVERHFASEMTDDDVATLVGLSASHFRYLFRARTGLPFHKYIISRRLERARELILTGRQPVSEIARSVGFANAAHFSRAFSSRFGHAPSALRLTT